MPNVMTKFTINGRTGDRKNAYKPNEAEERRDAVQRAVSYDERNKSRRKKPRQQPSLPVIKF